MDQKEFFTLVVPWTAGHTTIHWQTPGEKNNFSGRSCKTLEATLKTLVFLETHAANIYFCLSKQQERGGKRSRENAISLWAIWLDIDLGEDSDKYHTLAEALAAVFHFCDELKIPKPSIVVASGGGLHVYWLSDIEFSVEEWQPFANALKNAARTYGLKADLGCTGDAARILRVPGTTNHNYDPPRPVRILDRYSTCERHDFAGVFAELLKLAPAKKATPKNLGPVPKAFAHLKVRSLGAGIEGPPPLHTYAILNGCGWLREAYETGGKTHDEPQWNMALLCTTFMENSHELAHKFGNQHPDYDFQSTEDKWERKVRERRDRNLGWPTCGSISDHGSRHCKSCPHFTLGQSPLHLGSGPVRGIPEDRSNPGDRAANSTIPPSGGNQEQDHGQKEDPEAEAEAEIKVENEEIEKLGGVRPKEARLPKGFCFDQEGRLCAFIASGKVKSRGPVEPARLLVLIKTRIKDPVLQHQNGRYGLGFTASTDRGNWQEVFLSSSHALQEHELKSHLASKCVIVSAEADSKMLHRFAESWLDKLMKEDIAVRDIGTMGWRYEDGKKIGFVFGNTLYHENGESVPLVAATDDEFRSWYQPVGVKEVWLRASKLLTDRKRPELDILIAISFAAPLTAFSGTLYGATLSAWGEPGTSKSTAQQVAASVWGHPKQTRESLNSTPKSVQKRLGLTRNLAAYWDDIQDERHQDNLFQTMFVAAGGMEGGRLNVDSTMKARLDWQTLLVACSNASFIEYLTKKQKSTTAGMRRVFEFEYNRDPKEPGMINALDASKTFAELEHNYGVIGAEYAKLLAREHKEIDVQVASVTKKFTLSVEGTGDESYWWGLCGVLLVGAQLANRLGAEIDLDAMDLFLRAVYLQNRKLRKEEATEASGYEHVEAALVHALNEFRGHDNVMFVSNMFAHRNTPMRVWHTPDKKQIFAQIVRDENRIIVSKKALRDYLNRNEIHSRQVFAGLEKWFHAKEGKLTLGAGTAIAQTQEACFDIPVPLTHSHVLRHLLTSFGEPVPGFTIVPKKPEPKEDEREEQED